MECSRDSSAADSKASVHCLIRPRIELKSLRMTRTFCFLFGQFACKGKTPAAGKPLPFGQVPFQFPVEGPNPVVGEDLSEVLSVPFNFLTESRLAHLDEVGIEVLRVARSRVDGG